MAHHTDSHQRHDGDAIGQKAYDPSSLPEPLSRAPVPSVIPVTLWPVPWSELCPPHSYAGVLTPSGMEFGDEAFGQRFRNRHPGPWGFSPCTT